MTRIARCFTRSFTIALVCTSGIVCLIGCGDKTRESSDGGDAVSRVASADQRELNSVGKRTKSEQGEPTVPVNPTQLISEDAGKLLDPAVRKTLQDAIDAVKKDAKQSRHWGELGMLLLAHDLFEPSAKAFAMAELLDAQEARWPYFRAMALRTIDPETAIEHFRNAAMRYGADRPEPRLRLAELLLADEQLLETKGVLDDLLASHPNHVGVGMALAQWHLLADQPRECLDGLRRAGVDQRPTRKMLLMAAEAYRRLNAMEAAERQRELALKTRDSAWHDPIYAEVLAMRVGLRTRLEQTDALYIQNRIDESVRSADETVQAYPDSEWARILLARGLIRQRQLARAKQVLEETLTLNPQSFEAHFRMAVALQLAGNHFEACAWFEKTIAMQPTCAVAHKNLASSRLALNDAASAEQHLKEAIRVQPNYFDGYLALAEFCLQKGDQLAARDALRDAQRLNPDHAGVRETLRRLRETESK